MKVLRLSLLALAFTSCNEEGLAIQDLAVSPDLTTPVDLAMRAPDGVRCGNQTCSIGNSCCIAQGANNTVTQTCMPAGTCGMGSAEAKCDGPEDCPAAMGDCCARIMLRMSSSDGGLPDPTGGGASCVADCQPVLDFSNPQTKLCKVADDCVGYGSGGFDFDGCCSSNMVPGVKFCAPTQFAGQFYTCN